VLRHARSANHARILVLEDDLNFSSDFATRFDGLTKSLDHMGWDFWYPSTLVVKPAPTRADPLVALPPDSSVLGAHMFAVKRHVIERLVPYLEAMLQRPPGDPAGGPMHVDGAYSWFRREHSDVRTVMATRELGYQRPSRTDIHALKWFDRLPVFSTAAGWLRRVRAEAAGKR
jgi:hypothetical protein